MRAAGARAKSSTSQAFSVAPALLFPDRMEDNEHPRGALAFMLLYLLALTALWLNAYLRLWRG